METKTYTAEIKVNAKQLYEYMGKVEQFIAQLEHSRALLNEVLTENTKKLEQVNAYLEHAHALLREIKDFELKPFT